tara:strand:+ start:606 stop:746 length:141 start_codon:yes stop_codon:yes gene_type:complete
MKDFCDRKFGMRNKRYKKLFKKKNDEKKKRLNLKKGKAKSNEVNKL